jgi:hypothetical protein
LQLWFALFRNTIWNYFSTAQGYLDRPFNCFGNLGNEYSFLFSAILFVCYLGLSQKYHSTWFGSLYEVDDFGEGSYNGKHHLPAVVLEYVHLLLLYN